MFQYMINFNTYMYNLNINIDIFNLFFNSEILIQYDIINILYVYI